MRKFALAIGLAVLVGIAGLFVASGAPAGPPSARALEATLLAPCCFGGTIDVHDSEVSRALRTEIEARVANGESTSAIEDDLVARYGPAIRAMRNPRAFAVATTIAIAAMVALGFAMLLRVMKWRRASDGRVVVASELAARRDAYDDRLDDELRSID
jgi:cytochrome c-type biogenesis protein CcmH